MSHSSNWSDPTDWKTSRIAFSMFRRPNALSPDGPSQEASFAKLAAYNVASCFSDAPRNCAINDLSSLFSADGLT